MKISKYYFALAVLLFLAAAALTAYPLVNNFTSEKYASQIRTEHYAAVAELDGGKGVGLIGRITQGQGKPTKIYNIKAYHLTARYNAPVTIGPFYSAEVRHDEEKYVSP